MPVKDQSNITNNLVILINVPEDLGPIELYTFIFSIYLIMLEVFHREFMILSQDEGAGSFIFPRKLIIFVLLAYHQDKSCCSAFSFVTTSISPLPLACG